VGRVQILNVHLRNVEVRPDVDPEKIAQLTAGFTGADLANLVNEATILATRRGGDALALDDVVRAIERIVAGLEKKNRLLNPMERKIVAFHETGHALVSLALPGSDTIQKVSIIPRGIGALGYTIQRPTEDRYLMAREELENKMTVLMGGRAAEMLVFGKLSTGAADDLNKASFLESVPGQPATTIPWYSQETAREIDCAVRKLVGEAFDHATAILERHRKDLDRTARLLLERETLTAEDLPAIGPEPGDAEAAE
jgi:cell division protease FtsH